MDKPVLIISDTEIKSMWGTEGAELNDLTEEEFNYIADRVTKEFYEMMPEYLWECYDCAIMDAIKEVLNKRSK